MRLSQRFYCDEILSVSRVIAANTTTALILESRPVVAADDVRFLGLSSVGPGVSWWFVDEQAPTSDSAFVGPVRRLWPFEITTEHAWSAGSIPAIVVNNSSSVDLKVTTCYGRGSATTSMRHVAEAWAQSYPDGARVYCGIDVIYSDPSALSPASFRASTVIRPQTSPSFGGIGGMISLPVEVESGRRAILAVSSLAPFTLSGNGFDLTFNSFWVTTDPEVVQS